MQQRKLGRTGISATRLGLGLAALGRPGYITLGHADDLGRCYDEAAMAAHCHAVLDAAWTAGVRYFDAARSYGRAEAFLGSWLATRRIAPGDGVVASKWGYTYTAGWQVAADKHEIKEHSLAVLNRQWDESRAQLGSYLRIYQIHSATLDSGVLENQGVLAGLAERKQQGIAIGLTLSGANQADVLDRAMHVERDGAMLFDLVQATWNLLEPSAGPALARAHAAGMGVVVKEVLANGRLTPRNLDPAFGKGFRSLTAHATRLGTTVDALAVAAALAQPWADIVLSGAATSDQLRANAVGVDTAWDTEAADDLSRLAEPPAYSWHHRAALAWN